jgi:signal transduction histidine kinase
VVLRSTTDSLIFVVDDDPGSLRLTEQVLTAAGYWNVHAYSAAGEALEAFDVTKVDLVISDLHMPEVTGLNLITDIRREVEDGTFLPILVITADGTTETKRKALLLGASDLITKPIDIVEMTIRVGHLLDLRALHRESAEGRDRLEAEVAERTAELEMAMDKLSGLMRAREIFIASVSHELRTPLTAVLGFAKEIADDGNQFPREEMVAMAGIISTQAADLSAIIDDMLVTAKSNIGAVHVVDEPIDLGRELNAVLEALPKVDRQRIVVTGGDLVVRGDHLRVRQIIRNLLANALRHGGPHITVDLDESTTRGFLTVIDDGDGVPDSYAERLFDPYFHRPGQDGRTETMGLGLTVCKFLAHLMNGEVELTDHPDGTAFRVSLPSV